ncbi:phage capsid protein [Mesorhizobium sp. Z1-4]|uniref:phage capsid protein n=1 Tax=Mesorhizobium sp. Z1-4 TaxID=2448478 RepID=UPI000FDC1EB7|nr:phage capsid protein [Mesorhizobium sp. Z1-4]
MSQNIANWYREVIKDKVTVAFQAHGGLLDGTMMSGDIQANTVKFPTVGRTEVYKLTGAIEKVPTGGPSLGTVQVTMDDFEASDWWRTQDAYKAGPNEQQALANIIVKAVRRKRDTIKIDALTAFANLGGSGVTNIGDGTEVIDILHTERARAEIAATGADDTGEVSVFALFPAMWMSQLAFYKEFADAQWVGLENAPFSKAQRARMKTVRGVHYIEGPDEYFNEYETGKLEAFMWHRESMGAEMPWNQEAPSMTQHTEYQGSPWLIKAGLGGAAIGIQGAGVKRLRMSKIAAPTRPAQPTIAVTP